MQAIVKRGFIDSQTKKSYSIGDTYEGTPERIDRLQFTCYLFRDGEQGPNGEVYTVTQEGIDGNPELKDELKAGDVIEIGKEKVEAETTKEKKEVAPATKRTKPRK